MAGVLFCAISAPCRLGEETGEEINDALPNGCEVEIREETGDAVEVEIRKKIGDGRDESFHGVKLLS
jgi:hypothetical protein